MVTNTVTLAKPGSQTYAVGDTELIGIADEGVELARGIEPPTCGLQKPTQQNILESDMPPQQHDCSEEERQ